MQRDVTWNGMQGIYCIADHSLPYGERVILAEANPNGSRLEVTGHSQK